MNEHIQESLRRHRLAQHLTQEQLAEALAVTPQAVSRWECGSVTPDITTLIRMANYYRVTLDELVDMGTLRSSERMRETFAAASRARADGNLPESLRLLRDGLRLYPDNPSLMSELALTLTLSGEYAEAVRLSERVLAEDVSTKVRHTTEANLCRLYRLTGDDARADALLRTLPHVWESREFASAFGEHPELASDAVFAQGCSDVPALLRMLADAIEKNNL